MVRSFALLMLVLVGCSPAPRATSDASASRDASTSTRCVAPEGVSASPRTIDEVVALINALPSPVTIPCFLEALDRPLYVEATLSRVSAQPAFGERSPRIFLFVGDLVLSIVPDGEGAPLLEMSEFVEETRSRKAELHMPIATPVSSAAPYERVLYETGTTCGGCHRSEERDETIDFTDAFVSGALRPRDDDLVDLDALRSEWLACSPQEEPDRCAMLEALFAHGLVAHRSFPEHIPTL
ncbi:hypothetical protein [Sandaracinus amylolyticus]|uniref:Cytochrome c domain-containing protein n=1 Tax=Sandaracinus amylolyticus TaxID=927083 RepID=A0A0F6SHF6_9BACT|nr:hypothetical protein [Sandaracinus amylolyticus]AKF10359.1 hypothetical protein DB32_007508 [Sandaracinus amylolyticus]